MTQTPAQGPLIRIKPQPDVYTVMLVVAAVALAGTIALVMYDLMAPPPNGYGQTLGQLFEPLKELIPGR